MVTHFLYLTQGQVKFRSKRVIFWNPKFAFKNRPMLSSFVSGFQKYNLFYVLQLEMPKTAFQKSDHLFLIFGVLHSQKWRYWLEICKPVLVYSSTLNVPVFGYRQNFRFHWIFLSKFWYLWIRNQKLWKSEIVIL